MADAQSEGPRARGRSAGAEQRFRFRFTPAEWRRLLEDPAFLSEADNSYAPPRRLMGVPVVIVPDHRR